MTTAPDDGINADHDRMFALVARVTDAVAAGAPNGEVLALLNELKDCFRPHFEREERLMNLLHFPQTDEHRVAHDAWYEQLSSLIGDLARGDGTQAAAIVAYLGTYATHHFTRHDLPFAHWAAARNLPGQA